MNFARDIQALTFELSSSFSGLSEIQGIPASVKAVPIDTSSVFLYVCSKMLLRVFSITF